MSASDQRFLPVLLVTILLAVVSFCLQVAGLGHLAPPIIAVWLASILVGLVLCRWRGLLLLLTAPIALGPILLLYTYVAICVPEKSCL
jgi:hypothetical protein